jgi:hypothetical protein
MDTPVGSYYRADDVGLFDFEYKYMAKNRIYHSKRISYPDTTIEDIEIASNRGCQIFCVNSLFAPV